MFTTKRIVEFADTDMAGIVHFAEFFRYMEAAEHAYLRGCGVSVFLDWDSQRLTFPRVSASCDYVQPARFGDELTIERAGRAARPHLDPLRLRGQERRRPLATGHMTAVLCRVRDDHSLEPFPFPDALREKLLRGPQ